MDRIQAGYAKEIAVENLRHIDNMRKDMHECELICSNENNIPNTSATTVLGLFRSMDHEKEQIETIDSLRDPLDTAGREHQQDMQAMHEDALLTEKLAVLQAAIETIGIEYHEVEPNGSRYYSSSPTYGKRRSHIIDQDWNNITIEQTETDEKWSKRITFHKDQLPQLAAIFLSWYQTSLIPEETDDNPF